MQSLKFLLPAVLALLAFPTADAVADSGLSGGGLSDDDGVADEYDDLDDGDGEGDSNKRDRAPRERKRPEVREIVRGTYAKANVGGALFLGQFAGFVNPGTTLGLAIGSDFVDQERTSMAWEVMFFQGVHNGCHYAQQWDGTCAGATGQGPLVQGDLRTYTFAATVEFAKYPTRRMGLGARAGGGVLLSPLLMEENWYLKEVVAGEWDGNQPDYHGTPHPVVIIGPNFEYYTKLSHFSMGADIDVFYAVGFDLGTSLTGTLKYTF